MRPRNEAEDDNTPLQEKGVSVLPREGIFDVRPDPPPPREPDQKRPPAIEVDENEDNIASYARGGKVNRSMYPKGYAGRDVAYASGGAVLGRTRDFLKTPDRFRENQGKVDNFGKGESKDKAPAAKDKSLPAVLPQKGAGY